MGGPWRVAALTSTFGRSGSDAGGGAPGSGGPRVVVPHRLRLAYVLVGLAALLVLATFALYHAGGTRTPLPHLYYIPIVASAALGGPVAGVAVGVLSGGLAGPLMPLDTDTGADQATTSWLLRPGFFSAVGLVTGTFAWALQRRFAELARLNDESIRAFVRAVDARDEYTARHSENVAEYAVEVARALGLDADTVDRVRLAALLHDIGKLALPEAILNNTGALSDEEWELVKAHPLHSARIVGGVHRYNAYVPAVRHHHERWDGRGYPDGLAGADIPFEARILAVADAFDAMTSTRSYRAALPEEEALARIVAGAGSQFDPGVAAAFLDARGPRRGVIEEAQRPMPEGSLDRAPLARS